MPVYEYACANHGVTTETRTISERDAEAWCPQCGRMAIRMISAPRLQTMSATNREAWSRNERSAHEPRRHRRASCGHNHAAGESCSGAPRQTAPTGSFMSGGSRPWMLGH